MSEVLKSNYEMKDERSCFTCQWGGEKKRDPCDGCKRDGLEPPHLTRNPLCAPCLWLDKNPCDICKKGILDLYAPLTDSLGGERSTV